MEQAFVAVVCWVN